MIHESLEVSGFFSATVPRCIKFVVGHIKVELLYLLFYLGSVE